MDAIRDTPSNLADIDNNLDGLTAYLSGRWQPEGLNDRLLTALAMRLVKFGHAFMLVGRTGYYEPGAVLARSAYETYLWTRWIIVDPQNGQRYFDTGQRSAQNMAKKLTHLGGLQGSAEEQAILPATLERVPTVGSLVNDMAAENGKVKKYHDLVYGYLSNFCHGNSLATIDTRRNIVSLLPEPEHEQLQMISQLMLGLVTHEWHLLENW